MFDKYWGGVAQEMSLTLVFFCSEQMDLWELCENPCIDFCHWVKCSQWRVGKTEVVPPDFHHLWWRTHVTWWSYSFMVLYGLQNTSTYIFQRVLNTSLQDIGDIASIFIVLDTGAHWGFVMRVSGEGRIWIAISHIESLAISTIPHQSAGSLSLYVYLCNEGGGLDAWKEPLQL